MKRSFSDKFFFVDSLKLYKDHIVVRTHDRTHDFLGHIILTSLHVYFGVYDLRLRFYLGLVDRYPGYDT